MGMNTNQSSNVRQLSRRKQQGLVLVLVTAIMMLIVGIGAFTVDINHALYNRTRLQNTVDTAALAAAVVISNGGSTSDAQTAVNGALTEMVSASGNTGMDFSSSALSVQFSNDPGQFPDGSYTSTEDTFVRVSISGYELENFFALMFGVDKEIAASAVAGPSAPFVESCNLVPMAVCAGDEGGTSGYTAGEPYMLKVASKNQTDMGPGNFQLLDFGSGASTVRSALAGSFEGCFGIGDTVTTKPGNTVGPVGQGLNTRFGIYSGGGLSADEYPSDIYVKEPASPATSDKWGNITFDDTSGAGGNPWGYADYLAAMPDCTGDSSCRIDSGGARNRRMLNVPIVNCDSASGGTTSMTVEAIGCFFLLQQAPTNNGSKDGVFGEYVEDCSVSNGTFGNAPGPTEGLYRIVLYKDPLGESS